MAYGRKAKAERIKRYILIVMLCITVFIILFAGYIVWKGRQIEKSADMPTNASQSTEKKVNVVRAKGDISPGEIADVTKFEIVAVEQNLLPKGAVTSMTELSEKRVRNNVAAQEFLLQSDLIPSSAWYEEGDRLIEHSFPSGAIPATVAAGSIVDIKLFRANAEDPVVVAKVAVVSKKDGVVAFYLNALEQELLKEAAVEGMLFMAQYLDALQPASQITYVPNYGKVSGQTKATNIGTIGLNSPEGTEKQAQENPSEGNSPWNESAYNPSQEAEAENTAEAPSEGSVADSFANTPSLD